MTRPADEAPAGDLLEAPLPEARAPGLVPRRGLWAAIGLFMLSLSAFAFYDLVIKTPPSPGADKTPAGRPALRPGSPDGGKLGPAPPLSDVRAMVEAQLAKLPAERPVVPAGLLGLAARAGAQIKALPGGPIPSSADDVEPAETAPASRVKTGATGSASVERTAEAAVSRIFSVTESGAGDAVPLPVGNAGFRAVLSGATGDPAPTSSGAVKSADPALDSLRFLAQSTQAQAQAQALRPSRDEAWLREFGQGKSADAAFAEEPASPWMVFQGTRIPIVTREAINSDLPGQLTAISSAPVFDSIRQCALMIPQGTRFIGQYSSDVRAGQSRVLIAFRRMILPDGRSIQLSGAQGVDAIGQAGAGAEVDSHFLQMFGYGFAIAWIADRLRPGASAVTVTQPNGQSSSTTVAGQVLADTATRILNRNAIIAPTLTVDMGTRMFVTVTRDISLAPSGKGHCL